MTAQRTFDWVLSHKLKAVQKAAEEEEKRQNNKSTSLDEPDTVVPAELECLPQDKLECLPQAELEFLAQAGSLCYHIA